MKEQCQESEKISVIIPIYNVEKYLTKCLESVINQTYNNLEIILVDDGSTDNSGKICDEFSRIDKRIKVIHKNNGGLSDARNKGIESSTGKYISFIDSDDLVNRNMIEILRKNLLDFDADISICAFKKVTMDKKIDEEVVKTNNTVVYNNLQAIRELLNSDEKVTNHSWNKLYKIKLFEKILFPKGKNFEDIATTYKLFEISKKIVYSDFVGYYYYQREFSITGNINLKSLYDDLYVINERYNYLLDKYPELQDDLYRNKANHALLYLTGLTKINEKKEYYSEKSKDEYIFFKRYIKKYGIKNIIQDNSKHYKIFAIILWFNRRFFYILVNFLFKFKKGNKWKR